MRWTPVVGSLAINAALLALLGLLAERRAEPAAREPIEITIVDVLPAAVDVVAPPIESPRIEPGGGADGAAGTSSASPRHGEPQVADHVEPQVADHVEPHAPTNHIEPPPQASPWADVDVRYDRDDSDANANANADGIGMGAGDGNGNGNGNGIGIGVGNGRGNGVGTGGLRELAELRVPIPSKARPAKLVHPTRETEVEAAELFVAVVTVDTDGDVVGARMTRSHPGSRGDTAASMIWQFRYDPALDDAGHPVRSTFEQPFAVR